MVSCGIWDVAYSFIAKLDLHIFCMCSIRKLEHLKKSFIVVRCRLECNRFFPQFGPFFLQLSYPGQPHPVSPINKHKLLHTSLFNQIQLKKMRTHSHNQPWDKNQNPNKRQFQTTLFPASKYSKSHSLEKRDALMS